MNCYLIAAERSLIAPANGLHKSASLADLTGPLFAKLGAVGTPDQVILGNALGAGGNPARFCTLAAGLCVPSITLDSQCCSGLDSIIHACAFIESGLAHLVFAGGVESYSNRPKRLAKQPNGEYQAYLRPAFAPFNDVDMTASAAALAQQYQISRDAQHQFAQQSHSKAIGQRDPARRQLSDRLLARLPVLAGDLDFGLTSATIAMEADGAAVLALASEAYIQQHNLAPLARVVAVQKTTGDPRQPALVPIDCVQSLLQQQQLTVADIDHWQIMEAYAVQAMLTVQALAIDSARVNEGGGALARGHAIGASGAVLAVEALANLNIHERTICTIAAGGGLASAILLQGC